MYLLPLFSSSFLFVVEAEKKLRRYIRIRSRPACAKPSTDYRSRKRCRDACVVDEKQLTNQNNWLIDLKRWLTTEIRLN